MRGRPRLVNKLGPSVFFFVLFVPLLAGCTSKPPTPVVQVKGKVVHQGKGVADVRLRFWPKDPKIQHVEALSGPNGEFALECAPGTYTVTVTPSPDSPPPPDNSAPTGPPAGKSTGKDKSAHVPPRYQERQKTPLTVEVPPGGKDDLVLDITK